MPPKIIALSNLLAQYEGFVAPNRAWRNNNPGNCRYHFGGYLPKYGKVGCDKDGFAIFSTSDLGWLYLRNMLISWCKGQNPDHPSTETIAQMMSKYAPSSDNNDPVAYAQFLTNHLGIDANSSIKSLLN